MMMVVIALTLPAFAILALWFTAWAESRMLTEQTPVADRLPAGAPPAPQP